MKFYILIPLIISILSNNALAFQAKTEIIEQFDDIKVVAFVNNSDITNNLLWNPIKEKPPLSIQQAIMAINAFNKSNSRSRAPVKEIELREISGHPNNWHYLIKLKNQNHSKIKYSVYVVLMNGKVIPAIIEPESYK